MASYHSPVSQSTAITNVAFFVPVPLQHQQTNGQDPPGLLGLLGLLGCWMLVVVVTLSALHYPNKTKKNDVISLTPDSN